jgi:single-strand DNA-binding protein
MASYNRVILAGNLTRDPELRYTPKGTAVADLSLAVNRTWKDESGQSQEEVTFIDVTAFARSAEVIAQYLKKGRPILIEGRLRMEKWDDKQTGQKRSKLSVVLESFQFLDSGNRGGGEGAPAPAAAPRRSAPAAAAPAPDSDAPPADADDDVPF